MSCADEDEEDPEGDETTDEDGEEGFVEEDEMNSLEEDEEAVDLPVSHRTIVSHCMQPLWACNMHESFCIYVPTCIDVLSRHMVVHWFRQ